MNKSWIIGIDGGASRSKAVLLDQFGKTHRQLTFKGSSLTVNFDQAPTRIKDAIESLCKLQKIDLNDIEAVGIGLAGASNEDGRDRVFSMLDGIRISNRSIIMSDAEAAYEVNCPMGNGILVSVGTGVICMSRDDDGNVFRTGGLGHDVDSGSGFWIGKEAMLKVAISENAEFADPDLFEMSKLVTKLFRGDSFTHAVEKVMGAAESVREIASLCKPVCKLAEENNDVALGIIQEATLAVSEMILQLTTEVGSKLKANPFIIAGNGGVMKNPLFRNLLRDALKFEIPHLNWVFSELSPAYGAGLVAARFRNIPLSIVAITEHLHADRSNC
ncbi:MAG: N-acetylglucosamine kinase [Fidelibacterota bacterium]